MGFFRDLVHHKSKKESAADDESAPATSAAAAPAGDADRGVANYLRYEPIDHGTMSMSLTKTVPAAYLAYGLGGKPYPAWKLKGTGTSVLAKDVGTPKAFYRAYVNWIRTLHKNGDSVVLESTDSRCPFRAKLVLHFPDNRIENYKSGRVDLSQANAACVCHELSEDFEVKSMLLNLFLERGNGSYAAVLFE